MSATPRVSVLGSGGRVLSEVRAVDRAVREVAAGFFDLLPSTANLDLD